MASFVVAVVGFRFVVVVVVFFFGGGVGMFLKKKKNFDGKSVI